MSEIAIAQMTLTRNDEDVEIQVTGEIFPGQVGGWESPDIDPEVQDVTGAEVTEDSAEYRAGDAITLTPEEEEAAKTLLLEAWRQEKRR